MGAVFNQQLFAVGLYDCSINSDVFHGWVKLLLLGYGQLSDNSVIVMDNVAFHKRSDTKALVETAGHTIHWLPPYCPDLNPIEHIWAWIK
ncbi:transposase [Volucribacter amazonae]|uniref:transposase n=1 Tax=Volucribacter amazonae TaxID=256731 RepID=UPI00244139D4|nr:transposase [Volucribacter amazonae]